MCPKRLKSYADKEKALACRNRNRKSNYDKAPGDPLVSHSRWTQQEEDMVAIHEISDRELSKKIGRSVRAIQGKRTRLKKLKKELGENEDAD